MTLIVGIDPGLSGAIAAIHPDKTIEFHDCPTLKLGTHGVTARLKAKPVEDCSLLW